MLFDPVEAQSVQHSQLFLQDAASLRHEARAVRILVLERPVQVDLQVAVVVFALDLGFRTRPHAWRFPIEVEISRGDDRVADPNVHLQRRERKAVWIDCV